MTVYVTLEVKLYMDTARAGGPRFYAKKYSYGDEIKTDLPYTLTAAIIQEKYQGKLRNYDIEEIRKHGFEITLDINAKYTPGSPGVVNGPPGICPEPPEVDDVEMYYEGHPIEGEIYNHLLEQAEQAIVDTDYCGA